MREDLYYWLIGRLKYLPYSFLMWFGNLPKWAAFLIGVALGLASLLLI